MNYLESYKKFESKKTKRKIGSFAKHCINIGYKGTKDGKCFGKRDLKRKKIQGYDIPLDYGKDYYYDKK